MHVYTLQIFGNEMEHSAYIHEKYSTQILCVKEAQCAQYKFLRKLAVYNFVQPQIDDSNKLYLQGYLYFLLC